MGNRGCEFAGDVVKAADISLDFRLTALVVSRALRVVDDEDFNRALGGGKLQADGVHGGGEGRGYVGGRRIAGEALEVE